MIQYYNFKSKWIYTKSIEIKILTMCINNIKNENKYTNTLCRILCYEFF